MFQIGKTIISEDILDREFVCNLNACKGACCVEGEAGAPLTEEEGKIIQKNYSKIKPFLRPEGILEIEAQGFFTKNPIGELETTLVAGKECAYATFDDKGTAFCGIEQAYKAGAIDFYKPISCHLYPIRIKEYKSMIAINYHAWPICSDACTLGEKLKVPTYQFVKEALKRKFGENWYHELDTLAQEYYAAKNDKK